MVAARTEPGRKGGARKGGARTGGFTLLEVLVAVAILALSLTSLLSSQMASLRATDQARLYSSVAFLAEYQLVEIEWMLKEEFQGTGGWGNDDRTFEGDFADQNWASVTYVCVVDLIEMPEYTQLQQAADAADTDGAGVGGYNVQDAGEQAFDTLGMVWPIIKEAIEQSIRKSWCTVRWTRDGSLRRSQGDGTLCGDDEIDCMTVMTFWTDPSRLTQLPSLGGEAEDGDEQSDPNAPGGGGRDPGGGGRDPGGGAGGGGGRGGIGGPGPAMPPSQRGKR